MPNEETKQWQKVSIDTTVITSPPLEPIWEGTRKSSRLKKPGRFSGRDGIYISHRCVAGKQNSDSGRFTSMQQQTKRTNRVDKKNARIRKNTFNTTSEVLNAVSPQAAGWARRVVPFEMIFSDTKENHNACHRFHKWMFKWGCENLWVYRLRTEDNRKGFLTAWKAMASSDALRNLSSRRNR